MLESKPTVDMFDWLLEKVKEGAVPPPESVLNLVIDDIVDKARSQFIEASRAAFKANPVVSFAFDRTGAFVLRLRDNTQLILDCSANAKPKAGVYQDGTIATNQYTTGGATQPCVTYGF